MHFGKSMNLARIKAMCLIICALCKVQRVAYTRLASAFDTDDRFLRKENPTPDCRMCD